MIQPGQQDVMRRNIKARPQLQELLLLMIIFAQGDGLGALMSSELSGAEREWRTLLVLWWLNV